ncbi:YdcF family protein [Patescibacteria group bacterium]|nr:YdcF family protein [Patescibacteria group bacterium]
METEKRPYVLLHGCHLEAGMEADDTLPAISWDEIEFGSNDRERPTDAGRVIAGIRLALLKDAARIIFSTGASERNGVKEGEYIYREALDRVEAIAQHLSVAPATLREFLEARSLLDIETQNTAQELDQNIRRAVTGGASEVYLVTSPWHAPRVMSEQAKIAEKLRAEGVRVPDIFVHASHGSTRGTAVVEAPHRGDTTRVEHPFHLRIADLYRLPGTERDQIITAFGESVSRARRGE